ncbi:MAG: hypothetical protein C4524_08875 [Candidatus Zixiibacteriota bacterium]|nr:MAG: hypothetical protein C4524_08875 [candidate division Zixibacteria bacterium]
MTSLPRHSLGPALLILLLALASCSDQPEPRTAAGDRPGDRSAAEYEYRRLQAELKLADSARTYMVLDLDQGQLLLKLKGVAVWESPLQLLDKDSTRIYRFADRYLGEEARTIRFVTEKYLYDSQGKSPDSVLAVVSKVLEVEPEKLQREIPGRFHLKWGMRLSLEVDTDVEGRPTSRLKNTVLGVSEALVQPFEARLEIHMDPDAALTFWHAVAEGMPTLLVPPN